VLLYTIDFAEELVGAKELVAAARAFGCCVFIESPAVLGNAAAYADLDVAVAVHVLTSEADIEGARIAHKLSARS